MYGKFGISFNGQLRLFSGKWNPLLIYTWLVNMELEYDLVIFVFFFMFCIFLLFFFFFSTNSSCWVYPVTSCLLAVVATGIGIGFCFCNIQDNDIYHLWLKPNFKVFTNTWLECFYELFIWFLCYFCENLCFLFCFYFKILCKKVKGWIIYRVGFKKKKER